MINSSMDRTSEGGGPEILVRFLGAFHTPGYTLAVVVLCGVVKIEHVQWGR